MESVPSCALPLHQDYARLQVGAVQELVSSYIRRLHDLDLILLVHHGLDDYNNW